MGTFTSVTTASHRYYARKPKAETIRLIRDLERITGAEPRTDLSTLWRCDDLARYAMRLHALIPE